jgi:hypothetical protein
LYDKHLIKLFIQTYLKTKFSPMIQYFSKCLSVDFNLELDNSNNNRVAVQALDLDYVRSLTVCCCAIMASWPSDLNRIVYNFMTEIAHFIIMDCQIKDQTVKNPWLRRIWIHKHQWYEQFMDSYLSQNNIYQHKHQI